MRVYDGDAGERMRRHLEHRPELGEPLAAGAAATGAQVIEAVRHEMALSLEDVVLRRTALGSAGHPGDEATQAAAAIMAAELGWSRERVASEIEAVRRAYELPEPAPPASR
jgi:glycerol-3-phosphate dehydrogenase